MPSNGTSLLKFHSNVLIKLSNGITHITSQLLELVMHHVTLKIPSSCSIIKMVETQWDAHLRDHRVLDEDSTQDTSYTDIPKEIADIMFAKILLQIVKVIDVVWSNIFDLCTEIASIAMNQLMLMTWVTQMQTHLVGLEIWDSSVYLGVVLYIFCSF